MPAVSNTYSLQATYFRTALLLGIVGGEDVHRWAERIIEREPQPPIAVIEAAAVPATDLTELRHALWPLVLNPDPREVIEAVLACLYADLRAQRRSVRDTVTIVRQLRSMVRTPPDLYADLNEALVAQADREDGAVLARWLERFALAGLGAD